MTWKIHSKKALGVFDFRSNKVIFRHSNASSPDKVNKSSNNNKTANEVECESIDGNIINKKTNETLPRVNNKIYLKLLKYQKHHRKQIMIKNYGREVLIV